MSPAMFQQEDGYVIQADDAPGVQDFDDEANDAGSETSSLASITSSILKGKVGEGGRTYAAYGMEEYGMPSDEDELNRIDMCHAKYFALLDKKRFLAPINETPHKILDLGCGTGIWSIEMADAYPTAEVIGTDIAPTQSHWVPPNCHFELDDIEQPWAWQKESFDFIFARDLILSIRNWPSLINQCYEHLKPGGWLEFQCVTGILRCDDGSLPADSTYRQFSNAMKAASDKFGTPIDDPTRWKGWFEQRGFEQVTQSVLKLPCNPWPKHPRLKLLGAWEMENMVTGVDGMTTRLFQRGLGWSEQQVQVFLAGLRKDMKNLRYHTYWPYYVVYARKPMASKSAPSAG